MFLLKPLYILISLFYFKIQTNIIYNAILKIYENNK